MTEAILAGLDSPPDVIVAANDDMALGALQVVQEQGLDIAIIGFDALPEALAMRARRRAARDDRAVRRAARAPARCRRWSASCATARSPSR